eukprot:2697003-Rhodomonas_salina.1
MGRSYPVVIPRDREERVRAAVCATQCPALTQHSTCADTTQHMEVREHQEQRASRAHLPPPCCTSSHSTRIPSTTLHLPHILPQTATTGRGPAVVAPCNGRSLAWAVLPLAACCAVTCAGA